MPVLTVDFGTTTRLGVQRNPQMGAGPGCLTLQSTADCEQFSTNDSRVVKTPTPFCPFACWRLLGTDAMRSFH
jgi:hypothetical protein